MFVPNASLAPPPLASIAATLNGGGDLEHMRNAIRESAASVEALKQLLLGDTSVVIGDMSAASSSSTIADSGVGQLQQSEAPPGRNDLAPLVQHAMINSQIPPQPQPILSTQQQLPQMSTLPEMTTHQMNGHLFAIGAPLNVSLGALTAQGNAQNMILPFFVGQQVNLHTTMSPWHMGIPTSTMTQQVLPPPPPPPPLPTSAATISIPPHVSMSPQQASKELAAVLDQASAAAQPESTGSAALLASSFNEATIAQRVEAPGSSNVNNLADTASRNKTICDKLEASSEHCKSAQESREVLLDETSKRKTLGPKSKKHRKRATRIIEEIWAMAHDEQPDTAFTQLPLEEKRRQAKVELVKLQRDMKQLAKNRSGHISGKVAEGRHELSENVELSATATALLSSPDGPNEALEKAKIALAAIEKQTSQAREMTLAMPSGDAVSDGFFTSDQQYIWMSQNGMGSEEAEAIQSANAAAHQAQLMQQFQFHQQNRQHEQQQRLQKGSSLPSRFQDGYMPLFLCKKLTTLGHCPRGEACTFAHCVEELHPASPDFPKMEELNTVGVLSEQALEVDQLPEVKMKRKRSMCLRYAKGECMLGKQCPFAHKEEDLGTVELVLCGNVKTRICKMWKQGKCIYAVNCWDAHGEKEIGLKRPPPELAPKIKRVRKETNDASPTTK